MLGTIMPEYSTLSIGVQQKAWSRRHCKIFDTLNPMYQQEASLLKPCTPTSIKLRQTDRLTETRGKHRYPAGSEAGGRQRTINNPQPLTLKLVRRKSPDPALHLNPEAFPKPGCRGTSIPCACDRKSWKVTPRRDLLCPGCSFQEPFWGVGVGLIENDIFETGLRSLQCLDLP